MAEAAAAFYTIETAIEGAAVGAYAVSQSTTPLHARFRRLALPFPLEHQVPITGHSFNVVKGKAYVFGGDSQSDSQDASMTVVTLPNNIETGQSDYQIVEPTFASSRPLQLYSKSQSSTDASSDHVLSRRAAHASTSIGPNIYILAGRDPQPPGLNEKEETSGSARLLPCDQILSFSTQTNQWSILAADLEKSKDGVPPPRTAPSCASTPHPQPDASVDATVQSHGTIFLHGGYDSRGQLLRDTWAFDVSSKIWTRWPNVPDPLAEEIAGEGRIACVENRLWRAGDGFGKMMFLDFDVLQGNIVGPASGPHPGEISIRPGTQEWEALSFGENVASAALASKSGAGQEKTPTGDTERLPVPRKHAGFLPIKIGAGRTFLLYFMGQDGPNSVLGDLWSFQVQSEKNTPASVKDRIRTAVGKDSGENKWATCDVVESTKAEGQLDLPQGLRGFVADGWKDLGAGNVLLWGGTGVQNSSAEPNCWILTVE